MKNLLCLILIGWAFSFASFAQEKKDLPNEIRGYKVYRAKISVKNESGKNGNAKSTKSAVTEAYVKVSEPELTEVDLTEITFELSAEIEIPEQSGTVDFLTFRDFRVNGLAVEIEEYKNSFDFQKNETVSLPEPVKIFVGAGQALRGAWSEYNESKTEWTVTGRVFVFGRFKKAGFKFKRVVPVDINLKIRNPLLKLQEEKKD